MGWKIFSIVIQPVLRPQMLQDKGLPITAFRHSQSANLADLATGCALFVTLTLKHGRRLTYLASIGHHGSRMLVSLAGELMFL
jgi:hypothetical protein